MTSHMTSKLSANNEYFAKKCVIIMQHSILT